MHASGNLMVSPARGRWGGPFVFAAWAATQLKPAAGDTSTTDTIEFGGGLKLWMTDGVGLRFEARDISFKPPRSSSGRTTSTTWSWAPA